MKGKLCIVTLCLLSLFLFSSAKSFAQNTTVQAGMNPNDTIAQRAKDYSEDNLRLAVGIKAIKEAKLLKREVDDNIKLNKYLDSVNKDLKQQIRVSEMRLRASDIFITKQNNSLYESETARVKLEKQIGKLNKWERKGKHLVAIGPSVSYGYCITQGQVTKRGISFGVSASIPLIRIF